MREQMRYLKILSLALVFATIEFAKADPIQYVRDVEPILRQHCFDCHGSESREGGVRFTSRLEALLPGDSGNPAIVAGHPEKSHLLKRLRTDDPEKRMPLDGPKLSENEIATLRRWIEEGVKWNAEKQSLHWAYTLPVRAPLPAVSESISTHNEIDRFVFAKLESKGIQPEPEAEPAGLLRRLYFDLIGLPPSVEAVDAFLRDPSDAAYESAVDRLLSSKGYGEKWARHWLDLARYSDSNGYQADQIRHMWAYRDWVIDAFNQDMPFDQFTIEQLAGDLLPDATLYQKIATGFHRATTCNVEAGVDPEGNRIDQVIDRVNTTATVWLGTTLECAQCHNHKYDPFSQKDYYQLFAFFNNTPLEVEQAGKDSVQFNFWGPKLELPLSASQQQRRLELKSRLEKAKEQFAKDRDQELQKWQNSLDEKARQQLPKNIKNILAKEKRTSRQNDALNQYVVDQVAELKERQKRIDDLKKEYESSAPATTLVMKEMSQSRDTHVLIRGVFLNKGEKVSADTPSILPGFPKDLPRNRLGFAKWLVGGNNPLVARVAVNRWWMEIFGRGIVATTEDFGVQGDLPTHRDLLDWLAVEFVENGWSMKHIHKLIVMSAAYRQDSRRSSEKQSLDPDNRWLSRGPRFRLSAESIRDNSLAISGLLSEQTGGPPIYPPQPNGLWKQTGRNEPVYVVANDERRFRRGVYVVWRRAAPYPSFVNFDAPDRMSCVVQRPRTNTPLQALTLMNDQAYVEAAQALALRVLGERKDSDSRTKVEYAFRLCVARKPSTEETSLLVGTLLDETRRLKATPQICEQIVSGFDTLKIPVGVDRTELAAWFCVANILLNLDETITKS